MPVLMWMFLCAGLWGLPPGIQDGARTLTKIEEREKFHLPAYGMPAEERLQGYELRLKMEANSPFKNLKFRNVGPEIQGGRVVDIVAPPSRPATLIVAFATGGLWRTDNMGTTWVSLFDKESSITIGAIAFSGEDAETLWVGTGEANSSRTSYAGTGIFKSTDGGKTWKNMGLYESHHFGRIVVHPKDPDVVYAAVVGHLYTWNRERGLYKTEDGGRTWRQVLYVNERTGCIDVLLHPRDPEIVFAVMWERDRRPWNFLESGPGSGLYKSTDGGKTWRRVTGGLPDGEYVGRMGLAICESRPEVVYLVLDHQQPKPEFETEDEMVPSGELSIRRLGMLTEEQLLQVDSRVLNRFLRRYFPPDLTAERLKEMVRNKEMTVKDLLRHLRDANSELFEGRIAGAEVYRSDDGGNTWRKTHTVRLDGVFNTYGYYFGRIAVSPKDPDRVYLLGVPLLMSEDGGKTWRSIGGRGVHVDHHAMWIDPRYPDRVAIGNDGGINISWDGGGSWQKINNLPVGQFTTIAVDMARPYRIYGGLQDNGTMRGPSNYNLERNDPWEWESIGGGDGASVVVDTRSNEVVIVSSQFGSARGRDFLKNETWNARPRSRFGEPPLRYNWVTPIIQSPHHPEILYYGANKVFRSMDFGRTWTQISEDLTSQREHGDVPFGTITTLSESPKRFGLIYAGTDDGRVWRTMDGGATWREITLGLKAGKWISRVVASAHNEAVVYVSQNGYRQDDFAPYLWKSEDYGSTWVNIAKGLPNEPINVVREDPKVPGLLYVGTDAGVFVSLDDGATWKVLAGDLPRVPVHDLVIHPRDADLVLGTHGRSVFVADVEYIQGLTREIRSKPLHVFPLEPVTASREWGYIRQAPWDQRPVPEPSVSVVFWLSQPAPVTLVLKDREGKVVKEQKVRLMGERWNPCDYGLNFESLSLLVEPAKPIPAEGIPWKPQTLQEILKDPYEEYRAKYVKPGEYILEVHAGEHVVSVPLVVRPPQA